MIAGKFTNFGELVFAGILNVEGRVLKDFPLMGIAEGTRYFEVRRVYHNDPEKYYCQIIGEQVHERKLDKSRNIITFAELGNKLYRIRSYYAGTADLKSVELITGDCLRKDYDFQKAKLPDDCPVDFIHWGDCCINVSNNNYDSMTLVFPHCWKVEKED